ncbi:MAG: GNAT family N-acetyltransferase, partial [Pseudophaeobacter sp.]
MTLEIRKIPAAELEGQRSALAEILWACVQNGASVGFVLPFPRQAAADFWQTRVFPAVERADTLLFGAFLDGKLQGTAQLGISLPPNQPHRADVGKLLVHPETRR